MARVNTHKTKSPFDTPDISDQKLGNVEMIEAPKVEAPASPPVKYVVPPDIDIVGVNAPKYDCCVQKIVDEMGKYITESKMQFILGNDISPQDVIPYFPKYILYFRSGTVPGTPDSILANLNTFIAYYKGLGLKVYYYLDDYLCNSNNRAPLKFMTSCDGIVVSTNALKAEIEKEKISVPIHVLRTHMDIPTYDMLVPFENIGDPTKFNIFFSSQGRIGIQLFYQIVQKMNENAERYKDVHLVSLSHQVAQIRSIINNCRHVKKTYLEWMPLDLYYRLSQAMDLIIAPASVGDLDYMMDRKLQEPWLQCKSAHKYTLAGAARVPCIASPFQDYIEAIKHEKTGFIAHDLDDWMKYIDLLLFDKDFREEMGKAAREDVVQNWNIYNRVDQLVSIFRETEVESKIEAPNIVLNKNPKVMVHLAVHNGLPLIETAIKSCLNQTYKNQEIILSDNASDDGTSDWVEEHYPMVKVIRWPEYKEIANPGLRKAVQSSDCEYWTGLGYDDRLAENYWETVLPYFTNDPKIGITRVGCYQFTERNPEGSWWKPTPWINPVDILVRNQVFITSPLSRPAWEAIEKSEWGGWDPNCFFGDWDMWIQVILSGFRWMTCQKPLFWYRRHASAWSFNYDYSTEGPAYTYMRNKWMKELIKYGISHTTMATPNQIKAAEEAAGIGKLEPRGI